MKFITISWKNHLREALFSFPNSESESEVMCDSL